ncbi:1,4-dihydroxy-2-naphthoate polyprenyltransferase [Bisgaardia hudsonensis]|nr:1,4-dihydroxy-2-naphthoate polyprenyltransferase [Bisgaardia hudsonensis]QLB13877.1 1,4-dihydroxy-2-naphthoate polyprenyltransferase [Bisgaardia hudsonensis]
MISNTLREWLETARPKTLPLAAASIITGSSLAYWSKSFNFSTALLCLITTLLLQILSNFANDYGDHKKGSDTKERIGPLRGIQKGAISATQLKKGLFVMIGLSLLSGGLLIISAYENISDIFVFLGLGVLAIIAAITYTVGDKPYGYLGLGDLSVLIFFGLLGVAGPYYLQTHHLEWCIFLPALGTGLLASAVLNINNLRDLEQDRKVGKNTLAVRLGEKKARIYHLWLLTIAALSYLVFAIIEIDYWVGFIFIVTYPLLIKQGLFVYKNTDPILLRPMLAKMSLLALLINLLFSLGLLVG